MNDMYAHLYQAPKEKEKDPGVLGIKFFEEYYEREGLSDQAVLGAFPNPDTTRPKSLKSLAVDSTVSTSNADGGGGPSYAYTHSGEWGKMSHEKQQEKTQKMEEARAKIKQIYAQAGKGRKPTAYVLVLLGALLALRRRVPWIARLWPSLSNTLKGLLLGACYLLWKVRAPGLTNRRHPKAEYSWPIVGHTPKVLTRTKNQGLPKAFLELDKIMGFESWEMNGMAGTSATTIHNPIDRRHILKDNWKNYLKNSDVPGVQDFSAVFAELFGQGIFGVDKEEWQDHRKIASKMFSVNGLRDQMESVFQEHGHKLVKLLQENVVDTGKTVNLQDVFASFTFDTICQIAFGIDPDSLTTGVLGKKHPFLVAFDRAQWISAMRAIEPMFMVDFKRYMKIGAEAELVEHLKFLDEYIGKIIQDRRESSDFASRKDLLSLYITHARKTGQEFMEGHDYLRDVIVNFMVAGRDTTSSTLTSWFRLIGTSARGNQVADALVDEGNRLLPKDRDPDWDSVTKLVLGDAVFNEVMRMYPPVSNDFRVAEHDDVLPGSGFLVKRGQRTVIPNMSIGHDPNLWKDPEEFKPQRWMTPVDPDTGKRRPIRRPDEYVLPCFWGGPRLCLGKDMARFEAKLVAFMLLTHFRFEVLPHEDNWGNGPVLFLKEGLPVRVTSANKE